jgi:hypothetical protein
VQQLEVVPSLEVEETLEEEVEEAADGKRLLETQMGERRKRIANC